MIRYSRGKQLLFRSMALRQLRGIRVEFIDRDMTTRERKAVRQIQRKYLGRVSLVTDINVFQRHIPNPEILGILDAASQAGERE